MNTAEAKKILETALLCAHEPLSINDLKKLYISNGEGEEDLDADAIRQMLEQLKTDWADKGIEIVSLFLGWCFFCWFVLLFFFVCLFFVLLLLFLCVFLVLL